MKSSLFSFSVHLVAVALLLISYEPPKPKVNSKLRVQTVKLSPQKLTEEIAVNSEVEAPTPAPPAPAPVTSAPPPLVKKATKPVEKKKKAALPPAEKKEKKSPCLTEAEKKKIQSALKKPNGAKKSAAIAKLAVDEGVEAGFGDLLSAALQNRLSLAVVGSVKVSLTLNRDGKVKNLKILSAENQENRKKIESSLKEAILIPFGRYFPGEKEHEFVILLSGD